MVLRQEANTTYFLNDDILSLLQYSSNRIADFEQLTIFSALHRALHRTASHHSDAFLVNRTSIQPVQFLS